MSDYKSSIPPLPDSPPDPGGPFLQLKGKDWSNTYPLAVRDLHHRFARLVTDENILEFAGRWGRLNSLSYYYPSPRYDPLSVESVHYWRDEVAKMQGLLELWDLIKKAKTGSPSAKRSLSRYVKWQDDVAYIQWPGGTGRVTTQHDESHPGLMETIDSTLLKVIGLNRGAVVGAAVSFVYWSVEERLTGRRGNQPCLCPVCTETSDPDYAPLSHSHVSPHISEDDGSILLEASSLLAALYCLFALELSGKIPSARECPVCGELFKPQARGDARTCSPRCRQAFSRQQRKERTP